MDQIQILKKFEGYQQTLAQGGVPSQETKTIASTLLLAEIISNLSIGIKSQSWADLLKQAEKI